MKAEYADFGSDSTIMGSISNFICLIQSSTRDFVYETLNASLPTTFISQHYFHRYHISSSGFPQCLLNFETVRCKWHLLEGGGYFKIREMNSIKSQNLVILLRYFNFEPSFKLQWFCAQDLFGSQIPVTTGGFELWISCIQSSYLTLWPSGLGNYFVCKRFTVETLLWSLESVIQINLKHNTITVCCFIFQNKNET